MLAHYDPKKEIGVAADASAYGIGAVLFHSERSNIKHLVIYASRTLSDAEQGNSQIENKGLAIVFAIQRFQRYNAGRRCTLHTDHRPLLKQSLVLMNRFESLHQLASNDGRSSLARLTTPSASRNRPTTRTQTVYYAIRLTSHFRLTQKLAEFNTTISNRFRSTGSKSEIAVGWIWSSRKRFVIL